MASESQTDVPLDPQFTELLDIAHEAFRSREYCQVINLLADFETAFPNAHHTSAWGSAILTLGPAYLEVGRLDEAQKLLERGAAWARKIADQSRLSSFLHELSCIALRRANMDQLFALSSEAVRLALDTHNGLHTSLPNLCIACRARGQNDLAYELLQHLLIHALRQCDAKSLGISLNQLGGVLFDLGDCYTGIQCFLGSLHFKACVRNNTGIRVSLQALQGCLNRAETLQQDVRATNLLRRRNLMLRMLAGALLEPNQVVRVSQEAIAHSGAPQPVAGWTELFHHFRPLCPEPSGRQATFISVEHERAIMEQERNPGDIRAARSVLEAALTQQFRTLADGLALAALLRGETFSEGTWRQQVAASHAPAAPPQDWFYSTGWSRKGLLLKNEEITAENPIQEPTPPPGWNPRTYREVLVRDSLTGHRRLFDPTRLSDVSLRLYGGTVPFWNDIAINHQLQQLGSDFRVVFLGAWDASRALIGCALGAPPPTKLDPRFLFGRVAPLTAHWIGPLFDFVQEYAISPYLRPDGLGFHYDGRAVVRSGILRTLKVEENLGLGSYSRVHIEELIHALDMTLLSGMPWIDLMWINELKADLRRFVESPRNRDEIGHVFDFAFDMIIGHSQPSEAASIRGHTLDTVLDGLVQDGTISLDSDGLYHACRCHEMGGPWDH